MKIVQWFLQNGANPNVANEMGNTALLVAANAIPRSREEFDQHYAIVQLLLEHGANIDHQNYFGFTPLMIAVRRNNMPLIRLHIEAGADIDIQNKAGQTALDMAVGPLRERAYEYLVTAKESIS